MKFLIKKIYIILFLLIISLIGSKLLAKEGKIRYTKENISSYFSGIISANQSSNNKAFDYFKKAKSLKNKHSKFNAEYIRTLILVEKFDQAFEFSKSIWSKNEFIFEVDLLLGLEYFINKDYVNAETHFERLNKVSQYNLFFNDFISDVLIAWNKASQGNKEDSFQFIEKTPLQIKKIQNIFLQCYFDDPKTEDSYKKLINDKEYNFSRYNFFLTNYLLFNNKIEDAKKVITNSRKEYNSNLLIKQAENFILNNENKKIKNFFNCKDPNDSLAEFFYVIANLYSSEKDYNLSNFYMKLSIYLNDKFLPNKTLLAENYYFQKKEKLSKNTYQSIKSIGPVYSWYASRSIATILINLKGKKYSINSLENEFNLLKNPNFEHYYELANFYKDNQFYEKSIKYYSLALNEISKDHSLVAKILDRRGTSYERIGDWENAEKLNLKSIKH